jgi:hypothetical protein
MTLGGLGMGSDPIITMQLITVTNGVGVARRRHRFCHSFVHDNQSTWKNFHSFGSEHEVIRSEHQVIRSEHQVIRSEHKSVGLLGQWCGVEVWQRQLGI